MRGQCAVFAEYFMLIPTPTREMGNSIIDKTTTVRQYGITAQALKGAYQVGDVVVFNIPGSSTGHVALVNEINGDMLTLSEANYHLDLKVNHTRQIATNNPQIVGVLRGTLKVPVVIIPMNIKIKLLNNDRVDTMEAAEIADIKTTLGTWSQTRLVITLDVIDTVLSIIPYSTVGNAAADSENPNGLTVTAIDFTWMRQLASTFASAYDCFMFWVSDADWKGNVNGVEHFDAGILPATCQCHEQDATEALNIQSTGHTEAFWLAVHELRHELCSIGNLVDDTHAWLAKGADGLQQSYLPTNLNYDAIQAGLMALRATQQPQPGTVYAVPLNFPNFATDEFPAEVRAAIEFNATGGKNIIFEGDLAVKDPNFNFNSN